MINQYVYYFILSITNCCHGLFLVARVFSGYIMEVEEKPEATIWGKNMSLGSLMAEFSNCGGNCDRNLDY